MTAFQSPKNQQLLFDVIRQKVPMNVDSALFSREMARFMEREAIVGPLLELNKRFVTHFQTAMNTHINFTEGRQKGEPMDLRGGGLVNPSHGIGLARQAMGLSAPAQSVNERALQSRLTEFANTMTPTAPPKPAFIATVDKPRAMDPDQFLRQMREATAARQLNIGAVNPTAEAAIHRGVVDLDSRPIGTTKSVSWAPLGEVPSIDDMLNAMDVEAGLQFDVPIGANGLQAGHTTDVPIGNKIQELHDTMSVYMERVDRTLTTIYSMLVRLEQRSADIEQRLEQQHQHQQEYANVGPLSNPGLDP